MKVVLLAGGLGTRLSEETTIRPKPLVEIGGRPILWHIMKIFAAAGLNEFIVCLGYKGYLIKEFFANYYLHASDVTIDVANNSLEIHQSVAEPWRITLVETGDATMTGGRLKRVRPYLGDEPFLMTYGDGVADVRIQDLLKFHERHGKRATMTVVQPPGRFGATEMDGDLVAQFREKPQGDGAWINGGFFVLEPAVLDLVESDGTVWEQQPLETLARSGQLAAFRHDGFWHPLDTVRDKRILEDLWASGEAPWKIW